MGIDHHTDDYRLAARHRLAELGALLADPGRAGILLALLDGSVRPAGELAQMIDVTPQTASSHLSRLLQGGLLAVEQQGRHRYFRLADEHVAAQLEMLSLGRDRPRPPRSVCRDAGLRRARTCYDHLAGGLGVALFESLRERGGMELASDAVHLTARGQALLADAGLLQAADPRACQRRGRTCVDWTERRFHLAGPLGVWLCRCLHDSGWLRRREASRSLAVTGRGRSGLRSLGLDWERLGRD